VALVWTFLIEPRRLGDHRVLVPEPEPRRRRSRVPGRRGGDDTLLRSIDRIETDLNEVRSELERMRDKVKPEGKRSGGYAPLPARRYSPVTAAASSTCVQHGPRHHQIRSRRAARP
jgi:hypothetical protein